MIERIITYGIIIGLCVTLGILQTKHWQLQANLEACSQNQSRILAFCNANENTKNKMLNALQKNTEGIDGFNNVLDILFEKKK